MTRLILRSIFVFAFLTAFAMGARAADAPSADDTARYLAGLAPADGSPLAPLAKEPMFLRHASYFNSIFDRSEKNHVSKIREFTKARLTSPKDTLLYMFSGPDALHAISFFPSASTYILAGLEPPGDIPVLTKLPRNTLYSSLGNLEDSMSTLLALSFFRTKDMKSQLRAGAVYGTLPIMAVFLSRSGKTIHEMSLVSLDDKGELREGSDPKSQAKGAKVVFSSGPGGKKQTMYYFSTDISNSGLKSSGLTAFMDKFSPADAFIKSASYLMHSSNFSAIRSYLLAKSSLLLQDDSGIPLGYFNRSAWQFQPLGKYLGPIDLFPGSYQPQMADLFRKTQPIPLDFGIGYRWRMNESNMLLATKSSETAAAEVKASEAPPPRAPAAERAPRPAQQQQRGPAFGRFWPF